MELYGKTMGIVGFGRIAEALGMQVLAYDYKSKLLYTSSFDLYII